MRPAVDFNDQLAVETDEVDDVSIDWMLAAEFPPRQLTIAQLAPEQLLGGGFIAA